MCAGKRNSMEERYNIKTTILIPAQRINKIERQYHPVGGHDSKPLLSTNALAQYQHADHVFALTICFQTNRPATSCDLVMMHITNWDVNSAVQK